ncbi:putative MFS multidrug transporter [Roridomyces roridus]|uniref:MFS multidrug transporter n=1 Tax=Roridomyces roridus TaxID=1738132 RepID=A0AAD7BPK4_9AGAR|nr:putative MFS multidrug transporter [Roridomyces roridus]
MSPDATPSAENSLSDEEKLAQTQHEDAVDYPSGLKLALICVALCLSVFLVALDNTIIATAIPKITDHFGSLEDVGWYGSAYLLPTAAFQLLFGRLYTFLSMKWVYISAILIFELGSLICGVAPTSHALIAGRAIAGVGSAGIFNGALIILSRTVPLAKRPMYTALVAGMYGVSSVAGPLLGGVFTDKTSWRWCFFINLPIGGLTLAILIFFLSLPAQGPSSDRLKLKQLDPWGTLVFIPAVICLLLALQWGGSKYSWGNARIIALFVVFGVLLGVFCVIQARQGEWATVPPRIVKQRSMMGGSFYSLTGGAAFFILVYYLPFWFQAIEGTSAVQSGVRNIPMILGMVLASLLAGFLVTKLGYYTPFMWFSSALMAAGAGLLGSMSPSAGHAKWIGYQALFGLGMGLGTQQPVVAAQTLLRAEDVPTGTSLVMFMQTLGGALFISTAQNVLTNKLTSGLVKAVPGIDVATVINAGATNLRSAVNAADLPTVIKVYNDALGSVFNVALGLACVSFLGSVAMEWVSTNILPLKA